MLNSIADTIGFSFLTNGNNCSFRNLVRSYSTEIDITFKYPEIPISFPVNHPFFSSYSEEKYTYKE